MRIRTTAAAAMGVVVLTTAGCSTQPATNVAATSATLNGRLVNPLDETLEYHFERTPTVASYDGGFLRSASGSVGGQAARSPTATLAPKADWTDVSAPATGLLPGTEYRFRICGTFVAANRSGCLPERTFLTPLQPAAGDQVRVFVSTNNGYSADNLTPLSITASSGRDGSRPGGEVATIATYQGSGSPASYMVSCMTVSGKSAVIGFDKSRVFLTDGGGTTPDTVRYLATARADRAADDCGPAKPGETPVEQTISEGRVLIVDR